MRGHFDDHTHVQISVAIALDVLHSLAFYAKQRVRLSSRWQFNLNFSCKCRDFDFGPEGGLDKLHRNIANKVIAFALEDFVLLDVEDNVQVALRSATGTGFAVPARAQARAGIDPGWNLDFYFRGLLFFSRATAYAARFLDDLARAFTARASLSNAKNSP